MGSALDTKRIRSYEKLSTHGQAVLTQHHAGPPAAYPAAANGFMHRIPDDTFIAGGRAATTLRGISGMDAVHCLTRSFHKEAGCIIAAHELSGRRVAENNLQVEIDYEHRVWKGVKNVSRDLGPCNRALLH